MNIVGIAILGYLDPTYFLLILPDSPEFLFPCRGEVAICCVKVRDYYSGERTMQKKTWMAMACAGLLAGGVLAQPPRTQSYGADLGKSATNSIETTQTPPPKSADLLVTMLSDTRTAVGKMRDYSCTFTRQESIKGKLSAEQVAEMKVRSSPVGVYVRFAQPTSVSGMEIAYSASHKSVKMRYRAPTADGMKGFRTLDLDDDKFLASNRHPVSDWTMSAVIDRVAAAVAREKTLNNPVEVYTSDYQFAGHNVTRYEIYTRRPHAFRYAYRMVVYVDKASKLPMRYEAYSEPKSGGTTGGDLFEAYSFSALKVNIGIGESTFDY